VFPVQYVALGAAEVEVADDVELDEDNVELPELDEVELYEAGVVANTAEDEVAEEVRLDVDEAEIPRLDELEL
jgi:hypothetical protein